MLKPPENTLIDQYMEHIGEIGKRLKVIDYFTHGPGLSLNIQFNVESVSLQVRKIIELIVYSLLINNKVAYAKDNKDFKTHWRIKKILDNLEKINPDYFPVPIKTKRGSENEFHMDDVENDFFDKDDLISLYDECSKFIHTDKPFLEKNFNEIFRDTIIEKINRMQKLIALHRVGSLSGDEFWIVALWDDGSTHYSIWNKKA